MKIGIETSYYKECHDGISTWIYYISQNLITLLSNNEFYFYSYKKHKNFLRNRNYEVIIRQVSYLPFYLRPFLWYHFILPHYLQKDKIDVYISPYFTVPLGKCSCKKISVVHDLIVFKFPELHTLKHRIFNYIFFKKCLKNSDFIVVVSNATKKDLIDLFNVPECKIKVIYNGVDESYFDNKYTEECLLSFRRKYNLLEDFILYLGRLEPHKNVSRLVKAFNILKDRYQVPHKLVIVGRQGKRSSGILSEINMSKWRNEIILIDYIQQDELPLIYKSATFLVFPSLYEGFGLPVLEAMACGCPVVTSKVSSLPEIVGDAGILVDPFSIEEIVSAMLALIESDSLRKELRVKGIERARLFSWKESASKLANLIQNG